MYEKNEYSENKKIFLPKTAQDVVNISHHDCVKTSCCVDTTKITSGPCSDIKTSCCIDTTKE